MLRNILISVLVIPLLIACEDEDKGFNFNRSVGEVNQSVIDPIGVEIVPIDSQYPKRAQFYRLVAGEGRTCFNRQDVFLGNDSARELDCWGKRIIGDYVGSINKGEDNVLAIGAGHVCTIRDDFAGRGVGCEGDNDHGQSESPEPKNPIYQEDQDPSTWSGFWTYNAHLVTAGFTHTCLLDQYGVYCWGKNDKGQLDVPRLANPVWLASGGNSSCAIDEHQTLNCWGELGFESIPSNLTHVTHVDVGDDFICAVQAGDVTCWGNIDNWDVLPSDYTDIKHISAGSSHVCVLDNLGGELIPHCFGRENTEAPFLDLPSNLDANVQNLNAEIRTISAGANYTCASFNYDGYEYQNMTEHTAVECWGANDLDQTTVPRFLCLGFHATASRTNNEGDIVSDTGQAYCL